MINLKKIVIEGFCSIDTLELELDKVQTTIIRGNTGSGKTTLISAIVWALYGKTLKETTNVNTLKQYQPKNYRGTKVELYYQKDNHLYKVIRCQKYNGGIEGIKGNSSIFYYVDAEMVDDKYKDSIQKRIEVDLGMSYSLFVNAIVFGQGLKRFIQETGPEKREILEEAFNIGYISEARQKATENLNNLNHKAAVITEGIRMIEYKIKSLYEQLSTYTEQNTCKQVEDEDRIRVLESQLKTQLDDTSLRKQMSTIEHSVSKIREKVSKADKSLQSTKSEFSFENIIKLINKAHLELTSKNYKQALKIIETSKKVLDEYQLVQNKIKRLTKRMDKMRSKYIKLQDKINHVQIVNTKNDNLLAQIEQLKESKLQTIDTTKTKKQISEFKEKLKDLVEQQNPLKDQIQDYMWICNSVLSNTGLKTYIIESSIQELNDYLFSYSDILGFLVQFTIDLDSARKDIKQDVLMEDYLISYAELSGGQKQLCNLATAFAMNEFMNKHHGINIAFLDEVFENLDRNSLEVVANLISQIYKDRTLYIITHHDTLPIPNSKVIRVERLKGLSIYK
jgi:DNA repair exonuclease SbcCD ATPase subunit